MKASLVPILSLAACVAGIVTGACGAESSWHLTTGYLHDPVVGATKLELEITLEGNRGVGTLLFNHNQCTLNEFGDFSFCEVRKTYTRDIQLIGKKQEDPKKLGRSVYAVTGIGLPATFSLVLPQSDNSAPRLLLIGANGEVERSVTLEPFPEKMAKQPSPKENASLPTVAGRASLYSAVEQDGHVTLTARGETPTPGYKIELVATATGARPEFSLVWTPPAGMAAQVMTPYTATATMDITAPVEVVVINDANGRHEIPVRKAATPNELVVTGVSKNLSYEEALADALRQLKAPGADRLFHYTVEEVSGETGGITGKSELKVRLRATY